MSKHNVLAVVLVTWTGVAAAQGVPREYLEMQAAMAKFQASAVKPGDEALPCEALQKELVSSMNAPAVQAYAAKADASAAKQMAATEKANGAMTPEAAAALAAMLAPGAGLGMTAMAGLAAPTPAQMAQSQQLMQEQMKQLNTIMPVLMRSQRVVMLAAMKNCAWVTGGGLFPGAVPPGVGR